jgi:hypothetical protein
LPATCNEKASLIAQEIAAVSGRILVSIPVWVDAVDLPDVEAVGFQLREPTLTPSADQ